nr:MAG TPA: hypothetical protein [Caudoviricetes sp.]
MNSVAYVFGDTCIFSYVNVGSNPTRLPTFKI